MLAGLAGFCAVASSASAEEPDAKPEVAPPPRKATAAKAPQLVRARVLLDGGEVWVWLLGAEEDGKLALLQDDGFIDWIAAAPEPKWLERGDQPLAQVPPLHFAVGLAHASVAVREVCEALLIAQGPLAADALGVPLRSESVEARRGALAVLAAQPAKQWRARIKERLRDADVGVRRAALTAYAAQKPDDLRVACLDLLRFDESALLHHDAISLLGHLGDRRAIDVIVAHLDSCDDRSERLVAFDALRRITGMRFGRDADAWRAWWTNHRAEVLGEGAE
ncbi:MAG: hypothetical protein EXR73_00490 [Myxococcales bacterium]|nr:hypothetical protein [Myxococcales bacterium]